MKLSFSICAAFAVCISGGVWQLSAQTPANVTATIQFGNGQSITTADFSQPIGLQPTEQVNIVIHFPAQAIGQPVVVEPFDGGITSVGSSILVVNNDGTLSFVFVAPKDTGTKSLGVRTGSIITRLQFSVANAVRR